MASGLAERFSANNKVTTYDFDPGGTDLTDVGWVDMEGFDGFTAIFIRTIGTGAVDGFNIIANTTATGSGTDAILVSHAVTNEPNAVADYISLEVKASDLSGHATAGLVGIGAQVEFATGTDEGIVVYILHHPTFPQRDLTDEVIA